MKNNTTLNSKKDRHLKCFYVIITTIVAKSENFLFLLKDLKKLHKILEFIKYLRAVQFRLYKTQNW
jgi:hypothetical protein